MSDLAGLQSAIRQVPGVARASVRWPDPHGPAILRLEFASGADRYAVTDTVARQLVDVGKVDLATLQVDPTDDAPPSDRVEFDSLSIERDDRSIVAVVTLSSSGGRHIGRADDSQDNTGVMRVVAEATVIALAECIGMPTFRIARVDHLRNGGEDQQVSVQVKSGEDLLVGAAIVRGSPVEAVVRATLDAVNRRIRRP